MTLLSKQLLSLAGLCRSSSARTVLLSNVNYKRHGHIKGMYVRQFRWDGKPDNVQGHSFLSGLQAKAHPLFWALCVCGTIMFINWSKLKEQYGIRFPNIMIADVLVEATKEHSKRVKRYDIPSSLAAEVYDMYGEEGVDAMVKAWELQGGTQEPSINAIRAVLMAQKSEKTQDDLAAVHAQMMASAGERYKEEVAAEAAELGLSEELEKDTKDKNIGGNMFKVKAEEAVEGGEEMEKPREKIGFRERKIIEYENRIRQYSTPDKVFRYFATFKLVDEKGNHEIMMTPLDFLRSISPGEKQPEHLGLDAFIHISPEEVSTVTGKLDLDPDSVFYQLGAGGLISFSDYIFLLTVLSTSRRHFQIAFKMFDLNGDGTVDAEEFGMVTDLMRSHSATGSRHRDHGNTGNTLKGINSGLKAYFFGEDLKGDLTVDRFLEFQRSLQEEILALEFKRKDCEGTGKIAEKDFADLLIAYAGFQPKKKAKMLRRVRKMYDGEASKGVGLTDYLSFYQVLYSINDIDTALTFYHVAGAPIDRATMQHVARTVAHVELSDHLTDVVFTLFDNDGDGKLSNKEFVSVMKQRAMRGLEKPKDMGISRIFSSLLKCSSDLKPAILGGTKRTE